MLNIIPQKFSFNRPTIDAFQADKTKVKEELSAIFGEVLEYFE